MLLASEGASNTEIARRFGRRVRDWDVAQLRPDWRGRVPVQLTELVRAWAEPTAWEGETLEGLLAPPVPVPEAAPPLDRPIGLTGRDPAWPGTTAGH